MSSIGHNASCPCGSGLVYEKCCEGALSWPDIVQAGGVAIIRNLSTRGKNLMFLNLVAKAVGVDIGCGRIDWQQVKKGLTEEAVQQIHAAVLSVWPDGNDLKRILGLS